MTPLTNLVKTGFLAGCGMAASLVFLHILIACISSIEILRGKPPELLAGILFVFFISPHQIGMNISLESIEMWAAFGGLIIANGIIYSMAIPAAYFINAFCAQNFKKASVFFLRAKEASHDFQNPPSKIRTKGTVNVPLLGLTTGMLVAIAVTIAVESAIFFRPNYMMNSQLEVIVIFVYPAQFLTSVITEMNFSAVIFICILILINGIRYSILFLLFGTAWKFVCRHFGWVWMRKSHQSG